MPLVQPFRGLRPVANKAEDIVAPPYDVLNTAEARERVKGHPLSFLHISKPEIDYLKVQILILLKFTQRAQRIYKNLSMIKY